MSKRRASTLSPQVLSAASRWFVEFNEAEVAVSQREAFIEWLRASPEHVQAYVQISAHWEEGRTLGRRESLTVEQLIALGQDDANALLLDREYGSMFSPNSEKQSASVSVSQARPYKFFAMAASILVLIGASWLYERRNLYETGTGEQRSIKLEDGSTIDLNSRSRVRVSFNQGARDIELLEGQALFDVAKDKSRPFLVHSGKTHVRALGTRFDMYRRTAGTIVTVVEGRVAVTTESTKKLLSDLRPDSESAAVTTAVAPATHASTMAVELSAGEQAMVTQVAIKKRLAVDVGAATAWTQKQVVFRDAPLAEVVEEFNRYNTRQIVIADPDIKLIRISGAFSSTDPTSLLRALDAMGISSVQDSAEKIEILRK